MTLQKYSRNLPQFSDATGHAGPLRLRLQASGNGGIISRILISGRGTAYVVSPNQISFYMVLTAFSLPG